MARGKQGQGQGQGDGAGAGSHGQAHSYLSWILNAGISPAAIVVVVACVLAVLIMSFRGGEFDDPSYVDPVLLAANDLFREGNALYRSGRHEEAVANYLEAVRLHPQYAFAWANLGNVLLEMHNNAGVGTDSDADIGNLEGAIDAHKRAVSLMPFRARNHYNLGVALQTAERFEDSILSYKEAVELNPSMVNAFYNMGIAYQDLGLFQDALRAYSQAFTKDPAHVESMLNYCNILYVLDNIDAAEECFTNTLSTSPTYVRALVNLASLYTQQAKDSHALALYKRALELQPDNVMALHGLNAIEGVSDSAQGDCNNDYVRQLFDSYSFHFDLSLERLQYNAPRLLTDALVEHVYSKTQLRPDMPHKALDLGCGTGLMCKAIRSDPRTIQNMEIVGVDLSAKMVAKARSEGCYNDLFVLSAQQFLEQHEDNSFNTVFAADVLVYFSDLTRVLDGVRAVLTRGGVFAFTVEALEAGPAVTNTIVDTTTNATKKKFALRSSGRYAHSLAYIRQVSASVGLRVLHHQEVVPRLDKGKPISAHLLLLQRI